MNSVALTFTYTDGDNATYLHKTVKEARAEMVQVIADMMENYREDDLNPELVFTSEDCMVIKHEDDYGEDSYMIASVGKIYE